MLCFRCCARVHHSVQDESELYLGKLPALGLRVRLVGADGDASSSVVPRVPQAVQLAVATNAVV